MKETMINQCREELYTVLPLKAPFSIFIDPCSVCNLKCRFCAYQSESGKNYPKEKMSLAHFKRVIDDLAEFPNKIKVLRLVGLGEPLCNGDFPQMIAYAKEKNVADFIEFVTNGTKLTPELSDRIIAAKPDRMAVSIEALDTAGYEHICGKRINVGEMVENLKYFYEHKGGTEVYVKIVDASVETAEQRRKFFTLFEPVADKTFIEKLIPLWAGFDDIYKEFDLDETSGRYGQAVNKIEVCPQPFYTLVIRANGAVSVCCSDWETKLEIGNAFEEKLTEIWHGEKHIQLLESLLKMGRHAANPTCAVCKGPEVNFVDPRDNLDGHRKEVMAKYKALN